MDYSYSEFNQLQALGKYDIAALRFAYAREVELGNGRIIPLDKSIHEYETKIDEKVDAVNKKIESASLDGDVGHVKILETAKSILQGQKLKSYMFCTDENAGLGSTCNRFDEGTTLTEIAKFRAQRYKQFYRFRNLRDGRLTFNSYGLFGYAQARNREFALVRDLIEDYEFFAGIFGPEAMARGCTAQEESMPNLKNICAMIKDRKTAVEVAADLLIDVIKTPDHLCAVAQSENPNVIVELKKLKDIYDDIKNQFDVNEVPTSCFDKKVAKSLVGDGQVVVGENGKFLNGFKDTNPNYKYVSDRAVRGVWIDKVMAIKQLFQRRWKNRSTDRNHMALVDIPSVSAKVENLLNHLIMGVPLESPVPFKMENGYTFKIPYIIGSNYKIDQLEDSFGFLKRYFNMPRNGSADLTKLLIEKAADTGISYGEDSTDMAELFYYSLGVSHISGYVPPSMQNPERVYFTADKDFTYSAGKKTFLLMR